MKKPRTNSSQTTLIRSRLNRALQQALRPSSLISVGILTFSLATNPLAAQTLELSDLDGNNGFVIRGSGSIAVSDLGDVNGDGIEDLLIGAPTAAAGSRLFAGVSYVVFGRSNGSPTISSLELSTLDGNNGFVINGVTASDASGRAVSGLGDVNGDSIDDLLIGAYSADPNGDRSGASYVVFGRSSGSPSISALELSALDGNNGFAINGVSALDQSSGRSVSGLGDVNGDSIDDLLISAAYADPNGDSSGASYVVFGRSSGSPPISALELSALDGNNGFVINGAMADDRFGRSVSGLGDVNSDGIEDLIIGAPAADPNGSSSGSSYVIFGRSSGSPPISVLELSTLDGNNGFVINGVDNVDQAGSAVSGLGDVNDDDIADLLVGARSVSTNGNYAGASYVVFGRSSGSPPISVLELSTLDGNNGFVINGVAAGDSTGEAVSDLGDVNGDGIEDLLIGAPSADPNGDSSGTSYVVFGRSGGSSPISVLELSALDGNNGFVINGVTAIEVSGNVVSGLGDINNDGSDDLLIGTFASSASYVVLETPDFTPDAFSFDALTDVAPASPQTSNAITVTGITGGAPISVAGGFYSINGGGFTAASGTVANDQTVRVRHTSSASFLTEVNTTLTIGGVDATFTTTTAAEDITVNPFDFTDLNDVALSSLQTSNTITVTGINSTVPISVTGGLYSIDEGAFTADSGTVTNGRTVRVQHTSSAGFLTAVNTTLTISDVMATFTTTTAAEDTSVNPFDFTDLNNVALSSEQTSNAITVTGINSTVPISITGGLYSIDGGAFTADSGTVTNGQVVRVQHTSSANFLTPVDTVLTIGNQSATFTTSTLANTAQADLNLSLAALPNSLLLNETLEYVHTITNQSGDPTAGVQLTFAFPDALSPNGDFSTDAWDCTGLIETITCTLGSTLAVGASSELRLRFIALRPRLINTTSNVSSATPDPNLNNNQVSASTRAFATSANILINPNSNLVTTERDATTTEIETSFITVLTREPTADVTLSLASSDTSEGTVGTVAANQCTTVAGNNLQLTFTPANWDINQTVCITGIDDNTGDGNQAYTIMISPLSSDDPDYDNFDPTDISLINLDTTLPPDIFVSSISRPTGEDGTEAEFNITLTAEPSANVYIDIRSDNPNEGRVDTSLVEFTPVNWFQPQKITVTGQDDSAADGSVEYFIITDPAVSADNNYHGRNPADLRVINLDNEPSVVIFEDEFEE